MKERSDSSNESSMKTRNSRPPKTDTLRSRISAQWPCDRLGPPRPGSRTPLVFRLDASLLPSERTEPAIRFGPHRASLNPIPDGIHLDAFNRGHVLGV